MNTYLVVIFIIFFCTFNLSAQTYFQYDINGNQISASYSGDNPCTEEPTSSKDITFEENHDSNIMVFPNPTSRLVNIFFRELTYINYLEIISVDGKKIIRQDIFGDQSSLQIDLINIAPGLYLLYLDTESRIEVEKFIIE
jgi:hypothetical protein